MPEDGLGDGPTSAATTAKRRVQSPAGSQPARRAYVRDHGIQTKVFRADLPTTKIASGRLNETCGQSGSRAGVLARNHRDVCTRGPARMPEDGLGDGPSSAAITE